MSVFLILLLSTITSLAMAQAFHPDIPRAWDDREAETFEVPLAQPDRSARYLSAAEYYALDVTPIYRSYPVYAPGREPAGYMESLKDKEPEIVFDPAKLHTQEDWIRAGAIVFRAGRAYKLADTNFVRNADALRSLQVPATREGIVPFFGSYPKSVISAQQVVVAGRSSDRSPQ